MVIKCGLAEDLVVVDDVEWFARRRRVMREREVIVIERMIPILISVFTLKSLYLFFILLASFQAHFCKYAVEEGRENIIIQDKKEQQNLDPYDSANKKPLYFHNMFKKNHCILVPPL